MTIDNSSEFDNINSSSIDKNNSRFFTPKDALRLNHTVPPTKDITASISVIDRIRASGNDKIANLIELANKRAKESADKKEYRISSKKNKKSSSSLDKVKFEPNVVVDQNDKCDDATFMIKMAKLDNLHTKEAKSLFYANDGAEYLKTGLTYAQAYDAMRRKRQHNLKNIQIDPSEPKYSKGVRNALPPNSTIFVAGVPTQAQFAAKERALESAAIRKSTESWIGFYKKGQ